ncbi:alpha/beta hydrolase [Paraglaciecola sp. L3A3]|uniref:alpha/beta hydrolase n=1 Tax=Paraglaciecola sp. L3A3 TaxID=2686358 RepID=UPI00131BBB6E|nr:alpha/beta hydrolase [Paraglaciecola sp. L3A3]
MRFGVSILLLLAGLSGCASQVEVDASFTDSEDVMDLYTGNIPGAIESKNLEYVRDSIEVNKFLIDVTFPQLTAYMPAPEAANGTAVIICPGGGYKGVSIYAEGEQIAKRFNKIGVTAFVLKYRTPLDETMQNKSVGPLQDIQQAISVVRQNSQEWNINPNKVGVMGFSAGGHLASSAAVHYNKAVNQTLAGQNLRPDFQVLIYPVISFADGIVHKGSRKNLIGATLDPTLVKHYSNELQVTADTPPAFITHAGDDKAVPVENALVYYQALNDNKVPSQLLILPEGGHGFGLRNSYDWFKDLTQWMDISQLLTE